jgi:lipopolysaccharide transport system ATP-binding protein
MKQLAIKAENISKQYRLGKVGTGTLSHDLNRFWSKIRGLEDPYLKIGEANDRSVKGVSDYVWSLKDINFEIEQGDAVGIVGRNGAGKSTLLKLLSKVTKPTTGGFKVNGRIASLLEVGTGFNPEMSGRENIYLNGAILGMRRAEITRKLDEIIDFSGVERYVDTPVKRYSSGMYVRLAFAVAAHLESEILIVDEVLAVGDAEFQKKCLGKMGDVSKGEGRTVLFVSHNLGAVSTLCQKGLLLNNGMLVYNSNINDVLSKYATLNISQINKLESIKFRGPLKDKIHFTSIFLNEYNPFEEFIHIKPQDDLEFCISFRSEEEQPVRIILGLYKDGSRLLSLHDVPEHIYCKGSFVSKFYIPSSFLRPGIYTLGLGSHSLKDEYSWNDSMFDFEVIEMFDDLNDKRDFGMINIKPFSKTERKKL